MVFDVDKILAAEKVLENGQNHLPPADWADGVEKICLETNSCVNCLETIRVGITPSDIGAHKNAIKMQKRITRWFLGLLLLTAIILPIVLVKLNIL